MSEPLISVIVPVYNSESHLKRALESICGQTYKNLEIILVDDNSSDNSRKIMEDYASLDNRIKLIFKENNQGVSSSRNEGIKVSAGDYISFVDSDDVIHPKFYEELYKSLTKYDADISFCRFKRVKETIDKINFKTVDNYESEVFEGTDAVLQFIIPGQSIFTLVCWNKLYKREAIEGINFPDFDRSEDFYFNLNVLLKPKKVVYNHIPLYFYYQNPNSLFHSKRDFSDYDMKIWDIFDDYCEKNITDEERLSFIKRQSLVRRGDQTLEDYQKAWIKKDKETMARMDSRYKEIRGRIKALHKPLTKKFIVYDIHPLAYIVAKFIYDAWERIGSKLGFKI